MIVSSFALCIRVNCHEDSTQELDNKNTVFLLLNTALEHSNGLKFYGCRFRPKAFPN